jgi:hypothetical protein
MEDCGPDAVNLHELLCSGKASAPGLAETIGTALGEFIAFMHEWSRSNPDNILDYFKKNTQAEKAVTEFGHDRLVATLLNSDKDDLPLVSGLEVDPSDIQVISKLVDEYRSQLASPRVPNRDVVSPSKKFLFREINIFLFLVPYGGPLAGKHHR